MSVIVGMLTASARLIPSSFLFLLALVSLLSSFTLLNRRISTWMVYLSIALTAACRFEVALPETRADDIFKQEIPKGKVIELFGQVDGFPESYANGSGWVFPLCVKAMRESSDWKSASGGVDVKMFGASAALNISYGDELTVRGMVEEDRFPGGHIYQIHLQESDIEILKSGRNGSPVKWGRAWRNSIVVRLEAGMEGLPLQEAVLKALVLGYRKEMPVEIMNVFRRTGTLHIYAISGLHVGIVGFLLVLVFKTLGIPQDKFGLLLIPLLAFYVISTGLKSSAIRALLMASVFMLAPWFRRKPDIPSSVSIAAVLLLIFQPFEILSVGFIYSFTVVAFIVMVFAYTPKGWVKGPWVKVYLVSLVVTSIAASLASIPLTALYFGMFSPIALIGNLIVVPLTFCIVLCGWLSILLPLLSQTFNQAAAVFIDLLVGGVQWIDRIPGSSFFVEPPPLSAVLLWYASLIALLTYCSRSKERQWAVSGAVFAIVLAVLG